ncbi:MAG: tRNA pseudouridine(38-40) synthase TruA [Phycisphaeraceae bacterium]|nr:tRNA pseudouridine(38-40) synthase TruA [Phycisphaeraceae bacterium]
MTASVRYKLTIAYDGTDFCGWQKQEPTLEHSEKTGSTKLIDPTLTPGTEGRVALRTVQGVVERAVREIVREMVELRGASRTDSGVHARGQVAAFTCAGEESGPTGWPVSRGPEALVRALNGKLPDDVVVKGAEIVDSEFDPISDCTSKGYSYSIHNARTRELFDRKFVHHVWDLLDVEAMQRAATVLVGEHDFAGFAAAGHGRQTTVRTIHRLDVTKVREDRVRIDVEGNGFLWNMVRIISGTLIEVGRGMKRAEDMPAILESKDRSRAGPTLPPTGLCLEWIRYGS